MELEKLLDQDQLEAVTATEGYIRVIAGAGSGKTRALTHRFAYLVNELGILPGNILCVTFTNKAANEMRQRIHALTGDNDTGYINTFHGFCVSVLQEDSYAVQYPKSFLVLDNSDIDEMLRIIYEERGLTLRDMTFSNARDMIEMQKLRYKPDYYLDLITMPLETLRTKYDEADTAENIIFYGYLYQEKKCFGLDYNDLILFTLYIFREHPDICLKWQSRLEYIMIDEFQDIDAPQYELMQVLSDFHRNLFVVGDPDQTIYTWRGADIRYLLEFDQKFPGTRTIMMNRNYRSTPQILNAANDLIAHNQNRYKKELTPTRPEGPAVVCHHADTPEDEAKWITAEIRRLHGQGTAYRDITILYRSHYLTRPLETAFLDAKQPYVIYSGVPFFGRMEIKDALSYLRMIAYRDDLSFARIVNTPKRNVGKRRMEFLRAYARENSCSLYMALQKCLDLELFHGTKAASFVRLIEDLSNHWEGRPVSEVLAEVLHKSRYEEMLRTEGAQDRLDNLAELKQSVYEYETSCGEEATLPHYLAHVALYTNTDLDDQSDRVKLMTVHAAKGLEFPHVILMGMNEGVFPSRKTATLEAMEEERRLAFVAMTRAEESLYLTEAEGRNFDGSPRYPSRFTLDIDETHLQYTKPQKEGLIAEARRFIESANTRMLAQHHQDGLEPGARVQHAVFGTGTVLELEREKMAYRIRFDTLPTPRSISVRARLQRLDD